MIHTILNKYDVYTFNPKNYSKIVKNLIDSRGYLCYIDHELDEGKLNPRYERYLEQKEVVYLKQVPDYAGTRTVPFSIVISDAKIKEKEIDKLSQKYVMMDDFYYKHSKEIDENGFGFFTHQLKLVEEACFEKAIQVENALEKMNRDFLNETFALSAGKRFILLPFLAKFKGNYVEPVMIANIYEVGIITLQMIIPLNEYDFSLSNTPPNNIEFDSLILYEAKKNYSTKDYWDKKEYETASTYDLYEKYTLYLNTICGVTLKKNKNLAQYAWVMCDFDFKSKTSYEQFLKKHQPTILGYLINSVKERNDRLFESDIEKLINKFTVEKNKESLFLCSKQFAFLSFGNSIIKDKIAAVLKEDEKKLKEDKNYDNLFRKNAEDMILSNMFQYLKFYELTLIKKFFAIKILVELSESTYVKLEEFNEVKKDINTLLLKYDDLLIFQSEGSPKEMYNDLLIKTGTEEIVSKVQRTVSNIREDINQTREFHIKDRDLSTTILASFITLLFGFAGLKSFIENAVIHFVVIGSWVDKHKFTSTFSLWSILFVVLLLLNIRKVISYKK
ncbi:hypothetical protein [Paenibacillus rhizoplanae]|uniref:CorA-like Mg2+ transporter protein n=1 Tax=Paenibacillus rhizoplanae TaxID=1917181 RepID=A0ABW5FAT8_9BACL